MATKGIKRIRIHKRGEEGIDNTKGLRNILELNIAHPRGLKPTDNSVTSTNTTPNKFEVDGFLGGNETYIINSNKKREDEFLLGVENKDILLYQNNFPDNYFTASFSGIASTSPNFIPSIIPADAGNSTTINHTNIIYQFPRNTGEVQYNSNIYGNHAGWWDGTYFTIKELPNTAFRVTGSIIIRNSLTGTSEEDIYIALTDNGVLDYSLLYDPTTGNLRGSAAFGYPLGYMLKTYPNINLAQNESVELNFEFIVTQSHSRIWDLPIGPSYNPKNVYVVSSPVYPSGKTPVSATKWQIQIASNKTYTNKVSQFEGIGGKLTIEPITIIDPNDPTYTEQTHDPLSDFQRISGSFVQPSTNQYLSNSLANVSDYVDNRDYQGGEIFRTEDVEFFNLWNQNLGNASQVNLASSWINGRFSPYNITGSFGSLRQGWRYLSVTTTSSLIPINNTDNYQTSDFNPTINNALGERPSEIYYNVDYTRGIIEPLNRNQIISETADHANVEDSNYSKKSWSNLRYNGSRVTSNNINQK